jgi:hypothetical protein
LIVMADIYWTGDSNSSEEPDWIVQAFTDGRAWVEAGGAEGVVLTISQRRFPRFSVITRRDVEDA